MDFIPNHIDWLGTNECFFQFLKRQLSPYYDELYFCSKETIFSDAVRSNAIEQKWKKLYLSDKAPDELSKKVDVLFKCIIRMNYSYLRYSEIDNLIIKTKYLIEHLQDKAKKIGENNISLEEKAIAFYCIEKYKEVIKTEMSTMLTLRTDIQEINLDWKNNFSLIKNLCNTLDNIIEPKYALFSFFKQPLDENECNSKNLKAKKPKNSKRCILF